MGSSTGMVVRVESLRGRMGSQQDRSRTCLGALLIGLLALYLLTGEIRQYILAKNNAAGVS
jgi:hypothetical protein